MGTVVSGVASGRSVVVEDQAIFIVQSSGERVCIFEKIKDEGGVEVWYFDPWRWLGDEEFGLFLEELWHILTHPPFSFPLESCRDQRRCRYDDCCQVPPALTFEEAKRIQEIDSEALDLSGFTVRIRTKETSQGSYCWFHDSERGCLLFESSLRPVQCRWSYCWGQEIANSHDLANYIRRLIGPPAPSMSFS